MSVIGDTAKWHFVLNIWGAMGPHWTLRKGSEWLGGHFYQEGDEDVEPMLEAMVAGLNAAESV